MSRAYRYSVVDVFTETPLEGNPLAVFLDGSGLTDGEMQRIARELNLSETVFVFPPSRADCLARLRIFTPAAEMPFAGHPTLGTVFALVQAGRIPPGTREFDLEEKVGAVPIRVEREADPFVAWLRTPPIVLGPAFERIACARALGLEESDLLDGYPVEAGSAGPAFLYVPVRDRAAVDRAFLDAPALLRAVAGHPSGAAAFVFALAPEGVYARMFARELGVMEDPATGSATGPLGAYLVKHGLLPARDGARFTNEQGVKMGRRSLLHGIVRMRGAELDTIEIGGSAVALIEATLTLPPARVSASP
jgi:trans-2,3-dihydro-3-hydroxyanthranilate isomerase